MVLDMSTKLFFSLQNTSQTMENLQLEVNDILEKAHELEKVVCHSSCMIISKMSCDINLKWKKLVTSVDVTEKTLSHILEQWEEFTSLEESLDKLLMEIKDSLPTVEGEDHSIPWLNNQLKNVKVTRFTFLFLICSIRLSILRKNSSLSALMKNVFFLLSLAHNNLCCHKQITEATFKFCLPFSYRSFQKYPTKNVFN